MTKNLFNSFVFLISFSLIFATQLSIENVDTDNGLLEIYMENTEPIGGFQFDLTGISISGASGGSAASNGFLVSTSSTTVIGFSLTGGTIPSGSGTLVEVSFTGSSDEICFDDVVLSNPSGSAIDFNLGDCYTESSDILGCTDPNANNYNPDANVDDDSCEYSSEGFEVTINSTGDSHLIIFQDSITGLDSGDQIGVFDSNGIIETVDGGGNPEYGEVLVGASTWSGSQL